MLKKLFLLSFVLIVNLSIAQTDSVKIYFMQGNDAAMQAYAEQHFDKLNVAQIAWYAKSYYESMNYSKALSILQNSESKWNQEPSIHLLKLKILIKLERCSTAQQIVNTLLEKDSLNFDYCLYAYQIAKGLDDDHQQMIYLDRLVLNDSTNAGWYYQKGKLLVKLKSNNEAIINFRTTLQYDTLYAKAYYWLAKIYDAYRNWDTSLFYIDKAIALDSASDLFHLQRAKTNYDRGHYFRLLKDLEPLLADSTDKDIVFMTGVAYLQTKRENIAHNFFVKAHALDSNDYKTNQYLALSYEMKNDYLLAKYYLEKALSLIQPDMNIDNLLKYELAKVYYENEEYKRALEYFTYYSNQHPNYTIPQFYMAECYYQMGDYKLAQNYFSKVNGSLPSDLQTVLDDRILKLKEHLFFEEK
ncbi:MAG: tetratricopeptide repeat protein [Bacteroidales bacterium]|nr:tetratricopeptide repeat protein [Bacteroidales bacterium]